MSKTVKIVRLNQRRALRKRMEKQEVKAWLVHHARRAPEDMDAFGLVMFRHHPDGSFSTRTHYFLRDAADGPRLPEIARQELDRYIRHTETDDDV